MRRSDLFPSKYIKSHDINGDVKVVIRTVQLEELGNEREEKAVVYFKGSTKGLVLNKTNFNAIAYITGSDETDDWAGHEITLYTEPVSFRGQTAPAIRVRQPASVAKVKAKETGSRDLVNDAIPF